MCFVSVFSREIKAAGGQGTPGGSRATALDLLFALTGEVGPQDKIEKKKKMKVIRCVATFYSSFLPTWMTRYHGNNAARTCELKKKK